MTGATAAARFGLPEPLAAELAEGGLDFATVTAEALLMALVARAHAARPKRRAKAGRSGSRRDRSRRVGSAYSAAEAYLRGA